MSPSGWQGITNALRAAVSPVGSTALPPSGQPGDTADALTGYTGNGRGQRILCLLQAFLISLDSSYLYAHSYSGMCVCFLERGDWEVLWGAVQNLTRSSVSVSHLTSSLFVWKVSGHESTAVRPGASHSCVCPFPLPLLRYRLVRREGKGLCGFARSGEHTAPPDPFTRHRSLNWFPGAAVTNDHKPVLRQRVNASAGPHSLPRA